MRYIGGKPNLAIVHPSGTLNDYPFSISGYKKSYFAFMRMAQRKFNIFYIRGPKSYLGQGTFSHGYLMQKDTLEKYNQKIFAKVIYNKCRLRANGGKHWSIVNQENIYKCTYHKYRSYLMFKKFMKPTYRIRSEQDFKKYLKKIKTDIAVFKPVRGAEGKGILIGPKKTFIQAMAKLKYLPKERSKRTGKYDGLLQEFIDTSHGIPGIHRTYHDMRILIMNGRVVQTYIRIPKKGSYLANIARGGKMKEIKKALVPPSALKIARFIDNKFRKFGSRIYAIDFGFENKKPFLIEINPQPGLPYPQWKMYYHAWHLSLLKTLLSSIK